MSNFQSAQSVGEIVSIMPGASEVFKRFNIDFCCGGHRSLTEVVKEQKLDEEVILRKLDEAYEKMKRSAERTDFRRMTPTGLTDHIVNTHHVYLKGTLPELSDLTTTILRVHGPAHPDLFRVHKLFHNLKMELEQHLIKEEEILFPMIKEHDAKPSDALLGKIGSVVQETEEEHEAAGDILKELRSLTDDYLVPEDGCTTYSKTFQLLQELEADLFQHIHLENNILFRQLGLEVR